MDTDCIAVTPSNLPQQRIHPSLVYHHGLWYEQNITSHLKDGRFRTKIALCDPSAPGKLLSKKVTVDSFSEDGLQKKIIETFDTLRSEHMDDILQMIRTDTFKGMTLVVYHDLFFEDLCERKRWLKQGDIYRNLWNSKLKKAFDGIPLQQLAYASQTTSIFDVLFKHSRRLEVTDDEKQSWMFLSDLYDSMVQAHLLPVNPIKENATRYRQSYTQKTLARLAARSLSRAELSRYVQRCLDLSDSSLQTILLLHVLNGSNLYELCGLNIGDWKRSKVHSLSWLEISREYYQKRGKDPYLNFTLPSVNSYRKVVCSDVVEWLIARHIKRRKADGATNTDPLFVQGNERLQPEYVKSTEKAILDCSMSAGIDIPIHARGKARSSGRQRSRSDILAGTAVDGFKKTGKMRWSEIAVMRGMDRVTTYAIWYVDWGNLEVMASLKEKLNLWHHDVLNLPRRHNGKPLFQDTPGMCQGLTIIGQADPHAYIQFENSSGMSGSISEIKGG